MKLRYTLFYVEDVEQTIDFYEKAFGLEKRFMTPEKDYGEMASGEVKIGFAAHALVKSQHGFKYKKMTLKKKPVGSEIGFVTEDVQAAFDKAVLAGAEPLSLPQKKPWGQTVSIVRDCNGFLVEICSPMGN